MAGMEGKVVMIVIGNLKLGPETNNGRNARKGNYDSQKQPEFGS